ncbi:MAG: aspartate--tRNA ligase [Candidatus Saccharibacteria bacterium]|nr:aspartate--tRNA ligase [Candidatus Saccharibacteria bacterium]
MKGMKRVLTLEAEGKMGENISVAGWVNSRRDHGGLIFVDLRDEKGILQLVVTPDTEEAFHLAEAVRDEYVLSASGKVRERADELKNPNIPTGDIELVVEKLEVLNRADTPPVNTHDEGERTGEELRLKYRYLDLRRPKMQELIRKRSEYYQILRKYMTERDFVEVTTPILANSSPEGARDFLVPSRLKPGLFYALPQAPQQFKQLLMVGGVPRYFQIAPCFRDEDPRADRLYGDFYQLDMEMSFIEDGEEIRELMEPLIVSLVKDFAGKKLVSEKIPRLSYTEAMEKYGTDKPDLRYGLELIELTDVFQNTEFKVFKQPCVKAILVPNGSDFTRSQIDNFTEQARKLGAGGLAYIIYQADGTEKSPIAKFLSPAELQAIREKTGAKPGDTVFFGADERAKVNKVLGVLRETFAEVKELKSDNEVALCWVTDFPFYEWNDGERKIDFGHNPFSMPKGGLAALKAAKSDDEKLAILADQYDMVMNGYEICSGAVRNHNPDIMYEAFSNIGYDHEFVEKKFGGMLNAFRFGAPPHAGCAFGIDRIFMVLTDQKNIRDIIAFPKNGSGYDLMMGSPSEVEAGQLEELNLAITEED